MKNGWLNQWRTTDAASSILANMVIKSASNEIGSEVNLGLANHKLKHIEFRKCNYLPQRTIEFSEKLLILFIAKQTGTKYLMLLLWRQSFRFYTCENHMIHRNAIIFSSRAIFALLKSIFSVIFSFILFSPKEICT